MSNKEDVNDLTPEQIQRWHEWNEELEIVCVVPKPKKQEPIHHVFPMIPTTFGWGGWLGER